MLIGLWNFPIALVSASIGTILLAKLSEYSSKNQKNEFKQSLINGFFCQ